MTVIADLSKATPEQIKALQSKELEILKYFKKICDKNNLSFCLAGGSCIGAIRHKGFIPWDDDVDVFMMREDYENLWSNWKRLSQNSKYVLTRSDATHNYRHGAMTLNDSETTFINFRTADQDVNQGIAIDILPMDRQASGFFARWSQRINAMLFSLFINQRLPDHQGKLLRALSMIPLLLVRSERARTRIWQRCERKMIKASYGQSNIAIELVSGLKALFRPFKVSWFTQTVDVPFEDTTMPVPSGYDQYLTRVFGDYMSLPPADKQLAKHHTVMIDTETPYKRYRGKYYLTDKVR